MDYRVTFCNMIYLKQFDKAIQYLDCLDDLADDDLKAVYYQGIFIDENIYNDNERQEALKKIELLAKNGNDIAMFYYGLFLKYEYEDLRGQNIIDDAFDIISNKDELDFIRYNIMGYYNQFVYFDVKTAIKYYEISASYNYIESIIFLATIYSNGEGIRKNYKRAFLYYLKAAKLNCSSAIIDVASCYRDGKGVKKDYNEAIKWLRKGDKAGNYYASYDLGTLYYKGEYVKEDKKIAKKYFSKAAHGGIPYAMHNLANIYYADSDYKNAYKWYFKASQFDVNESMLALGNMCEMGLGVKKDLKRALLWYEAASNYLDTAKELYLTLKDEIQFGEEKAIDNSLIRMANRGNVDAMIKLYSKCLIKEEFDEAFFWIKKAASAGDSTSLYSLGRMYELGIGVEKNYKLAINAYEKASIRGNIDATMVLAELYYLGEFVDKDSFKAISYLKKAHELGEKDASYNLGVICEEELDMKDEAFFWYKESASKGQIDAQNRLGEIYLEKNKFEDAFSLFKKSANRGCVKAFYNLGLCYENGSGINKSINNAIKWYEKASKKGIKKAEVRIQEIKNENKNINNSL